MSEDVLAALVSGYVLGGMITLMSMDAPSKCAALRRRVFLWPLYWVYLVVKMGFMLAHEVRR